MNYDLNTACSRYIAVRYIFDTISTGEVIKMTGVLTIREDFILSTSIKRYNSKCNHLHEEKLTMERSQQNCYTCQIEDSVSFCITHCYSKCYYVMSNQSYLYAPFDMYMWFIFLIYSYFCMISLSDLCLLFYCIWLPQLKSQCVIIVMP